MFKFCLLLASLMWAHTCHAAPLVLAFDELLPWKTKEGGRFAGAYTEIVRELAQRVEVPLEIIECPLKRCLLLLESGGADIVIGLKDTAERRQYLHFLQTPYRKKSSDKVFYVAKDKDSGKGVQINTYADLKGLRIGTKLGAEYFPRFDQDVKLSKDAVKQMDVNFQKLLLGRLDAVVIAEDQGEALLARLRLRDAVQKAAYREPDPSPRRIGISKKSPHAANLAAFEAAMAAMVQDGTLAALINQHYYLAYHLPHTAVPIR